MYVLYFMNNSVLSTRGHSTWIVLFQPLYKNSKRHRCMQEVSTRSIPHSTAAAFSADDMRKKEKKKRNVACRVDIYPLTPAGAYRMRVNPAEGQVGSTRTQQTVDVLLALPMALDAPPPTAYYILLFTGSPGTSPEARRLAPGMKRQFFFFLPTPNFALFFSLTGLRSWEPDTWVQVCEHMYYSGYRPPSWF